MTSLYGLLDPRDKRVRYVGITEKSLAVRLEEHIAEARTGSKRYVFNWIRQLLSAGLKPEIVELEQCTSWEEACTREKHWIAKTPNLTNMTVGGDGVRGYVRTEEDRAKYQKGAERQWSDPKQVETHREFMKDLWQGKIGDRLRTERSSPEGIQKRWFKLMYTCPCGIEYHVAKYAAFVRNDKLCQCGRAIPRKEELRDKR